jgi:tetratricopeptide (TPR) repeat protein
MKRTSSSGLPAADVATPASDGGKRHFDTFETEFFKDGDAVSANAAAAEAERFDDLEDGNCRRFVPSRQFVMGVVAASACLAVIGCVALWRSGSPSQQTATIPENYVQPAAAAAPSPAPAAAAAPAAVPAPAPVVAEQPQAAPAAAPSPVAAPAAAPAAASAAPVAAVAAGEPAVVGPAVAMPAPAPAEPERPAAKAATLAQEPAAEHRAVATAGALGDAAAARARCKETVSGRRQKELVSVCSDAFAVDPTAADLAVILAKAEFDKGHAAQAMAWSQKALAADPNAADAYVFIGGVEQGAGHKKAAKEAYKRYLQLAPGGRYAGDLRAIVGSL